MSVSVHRWAVIVGAALCASCGMSASSDATFVRGREGASSGGMSHVDESPGELPSRPLISVTEGWSGGRAIAYGQTVSGELRVGTMALPSGALADEYVFVGTAGDSIRAELHGGPLVNSPGSHMDMYLYLLHGGQEIARDDDSAGNLDSRIDMTLPSSGLYVLRASTFGGGPREGSYSLTLARTGGM